MGITAAIIGAAGAVASYDAAQDQKKAAKRAEAEARNAQSEREAAAAKATQDAYAQQQFSKRALRENSLFTGSDIGLSGGRQTLGV